MNAVTENKKLTSKETVLQAYPDACAVKQPDSTWKIYTAPQGGRSISDLASNPNQAWNHAAKALTANERGLAWAGAWSEGEHFVAVDPAAPNGDYGVKMTAHMADSVLVVDDIEYTPTRTGEDFVHVDQNGAVRTQVANRPTTGDTPQETTFIATAPVSKPRKKIIHVAATTHALGHKKAKGADQAAKAKRKAANKSRQKNRK